MLGAGAVSASFPASIARALEIQANNRTGTIRDVEHIVILMQENRSFDGISRTAMAATCCPSGLTFPTWG
jgi:phospholipase C